jgi:hypothetical protein
MVVFYNAKRDVTPVGSGFGFNSRHLPFVAGVILTLLGAIEAGAAVINVSSVSLTDVAAAVAAAGDGDTLMVPAGTATWTSGITINKAIKIIGAGSGAFIGHSETSQAIGTGSKTFTFTARPGYTPTAGDTVRAIFPCNGSNFMQGTVTSFSGSTLVVNVTSTGGTGSQPFWTFLTIPISITTIVNSSNSGALLNVNESVNGHVDISGIYFQASNSNGATPNGDNVEINYASGGQAVLIHDCRSSVAGVGAYGFRSSTNRGVIYRCSFDSQFQSIVGHNGLGWNDIGIGFINFSDSTGSWSSNSTMGASDTTGLNNFYVEDCYFAAMPIQAMDAGASARVVVRHCIFDNSGFTSHGADTGPLGLRYLEAYNNTLVFTSGGDSDGSKTLALNWFWLMRGGTAVITDNVLPAISSTAWGVKGSVQMTVENVRRNAGPYPCWTTYPAPHQVGQGYISGLVTEPVYVWNNTGTAGNNVGLQDYNPDECGNNEQMSTFIQSGRDYITGTAKPGYSKYTYPHPLVAQSVTAPANLHVQ